MNLCSNLEIRLYIKARVLQHIIDLDLCKLFKSYDVNNTEYSYCLEKFLTTNESFNQIQNVSFLCYIPNATSVSIVSIVSVIT